MFAVSLSRSLALASVKVYLAAIGSLAWIQKPSAQQPKIEDGAARSEGAHATTSQQLRNRSQQDYWPCTVLKVAVQAQQTNAISSPNTGGVFWLLTVSEFTAPSKKTFNHRLHATQDCINWGGDYFTFYIKRSKRTKITTANIMSTSDGQAALSAWTTNRYLHQQTPKDPVQQQKKHANQAQLPQTHVAPPPASRLLTRAVQYPQFPDWCSHTCSATGHAAHSHPATGQVA